MNVDNWMIVPCDIDKWVDKTQTLLTLRSNSKPQTESLWIIGISGILSFDGNEEITMQ
jgi:hypothetical protein